LFSIASSYRKVRPAQWGYIFGIWTLAAFSLATQYYFNSLSRSPAESWLELFWMQLPVWYLCALLTPIVMGLYEAYPLDTPRWKQNLSKHLGAALGVLLVFSNLRLLSILLLWNPVLLHNLTWRTYASSIVAQLAWDVAIYLLILIVLYANRSHTLRKDRELYAAQVELRNQELQNQLNLAQLEALKLQLSPHFLFNTLNTVSSLIRTKEYDLAIGVNTRLGDFLRATLAYGQVQQVSLEQELAFVDLYLDIETIRFKDRLIVTKDIASDCLRLPVPYLILQPLIENAIKHGINRHRNARLIAIRAEIRNDKLEIRLYNDGASLPEDWTEKDKPGIGLKNGQQRLDKLYAGKASLRLQNDPDRPGTVAVLQIPLP
jgi:two-component system, LytTR family, sensor kinase